MAGDRILVVDDDKDIRHIVKVYLENNGYIVDEAESGEEGLKKVEGNRIDLLLLDVMMPKMDGITLCMKIREKCNIPIIMLSARDTSIDKALGLTSGADDYISKPFNAVELLARVRAQLRRFKELNPNDEENAKFNYGDLSMDIKTHRVRKNGEEIRLTPTEFKILKLLWSNKGIVFSTERIFEKVWGEDNFDVDNTVMVHIRNLREKVEDNNRKPEYIKTIWGTGYKFGE